MEENKNKWTGTLPGQVAIGLGVLLVVLLTAFALNSKSLIFSGDKVVIDGKSYSLKDIEKENPSLFNRYLTESVSLKKEIFSKFAEKKILELAAKEAGVGDPDQYLKQGFEPQNISDSELLGIYNQYKSQLGGKTFSETKEIIRKQLLMNQEMQFAQSRQKELVQKYKVNFHIEEPPAVRHAITESGNPSLGPEKAPVTVIEFSDFECPFCKRSQEVNKRLREKYKDKIRWVFRDYPLDFHENAMYAHIAANCAIPQNKYWDFFEILFQNTGNLSATNVDYLATKAGLDKSKFMECMKDQGKLRSEVEADIQEGQKFGVTGTPAFFINGIFVSGAMPFEHFDEIIEKELK